MSDDSQTLVSRDNPRLGYVSFYQRLIRLVRRPSLKNKKRKNGIGRPRGKKNSIDDKIAFHPGFALIILPRPSTCRPIKVRRNESR